MFIQRSSCWILSWPEMTAEPCEDPCCQALHMLTLVAQINWELEPQIWIFCQSSEQLITYKTPTDFIFINNYFIFLRKSFLMDYYFTCLHFKGTIYPHCGLIIRKLCKAHLPFQVSKEDSLVCLPIEFSTTLYYLQL